MQRLQALLVNARETVKEISPKELQRMLATDPQPTVLDVRELSEWQGGHIPQATHLSKGYVECKIEQMVNDVKQPLVLYCQGGVRSLLAAKQLQQMGYQQVMSLDGGFAGWCEASGDVLID